MTIVTKAIAEKTKDILIAAGDVETYVHHIINKKTKAPAPDVESPVDEDRRQLVARAHRARVSSTLCCYLALLLIIGVTVIGGIYVYRQMNMSQYRKFRGWCGVPFDERTREFRRPKASKLGWLGGELNGNTNFDWHTSDKNSDDVMNVIKMSQAHSYFPELFEIDIENEYEKIEVPEFKGGRKATFVHDFAVNKTGILDVQGKRCFVMDLDRENILPPKNVRDLLRKMWQGYYSVDTSVLRKTMRVVQPPRTSMKGLGMITSTICSQYPVYELKPVRTVNKRSLDGEHFDFTEFVGQHVLQFNIVNLAELD